MTICNICGGNEGVCDCNFKKCPFSGAPLTLNNTGQLSMGEIQQILDYGITKMDFIWMINPGHLGNDSPYNFLFFRNGQIFSYWRRWKPVEKGETWEHFKHKGRSL